MDLNEAGIECLRIATTRSQYESDCSIDTLELLKHLSGEVVEATEAWMNQKKKPGEFAGELSDVVVIALIILEKHCFDIEKCIKKTIDKNRQRADNDVIENIGKK